MVEKKKKGGTNVGNALRWLAKQGKTIAPNLLDLAGDITGISSLEKLGQAISGNKQLTDQDKEMLLEELRQDTIEMQEVTKRWTADMLSDSWLSKNIRPLSLAFLTVTLFVYIILDSSLEGFTIADNWIDLLSSLLLLVYGGYFGFRSAEKITKEWRKNK